MKRNTSLSVLVFLIVSTAGAAAWADHGHGHGSRTHVGIAIGVPLGYPFYYPYYPPYYYPPVVAAPAPPPVYIEQNESAPDAGLSNYWYYCTPSQAYYPYVKTCPEGWLTVVPQPAPHP